MKKLFILISIFSVLFFLFSCAEDIPFDLGLTKTTIRVNEEVELNPNKENISFVFEKEGYLEVKDNTLKGLKEGQCTLKVVDEHKLEIYEQVITITPASIEITNSIETLLVGSTHQFISNFEDAIYTSSNEEVLKCSELGLVEAIAKGEATITVTADGLNIALKVTVLEEDIEVEPIIPVSLEIIGFDSLGDTYLGYFIEYKVKTTPEDASNSVIWSTTDEDILKIDSSTGEVLSFSKGVVTVKATSTLNSEVYASLKVDVNIETPFEKQEEVTIACLNKYLHKVDPFNKNYQGFEKLIYQNALVAIEEKYNIKIKFLGVDSFEDCEASIIVYDPYVDFNLVKHLNIIKTQDDFIVDPYEQLGLVYDSKVIEELGLVNPYELYKNNQWNYNTFISWLSEAQKVSGSKVLGSNILEMLQGLSNESGNSIDIYDANAKKYTYDLNNSSAQFKLIKTLQTQGLLDDDFYIDDDLGDYLMASAFYDYKLYGYSFVPFPSDNKAEYVSSKRTLSASTLFKDHRSNSYERAIFSIIYNITTNRTRVDDPLVDRDTLFILHSQIFEDHLVVLLDRSDHFPRDNFIWRALGDEDIFNEVLAYIENDFD